MNIINLKYLIIKNVIILISQEKVKTFSYEVVLW